MPSPQVPEIDTIKLVTEFHGEYMVLHVTEETDPGSGVKKTVTTKWTEKSKLGAGGFGTVYLQESDRGELRAVKEIPRNQAKFDPSREIRALKAMSDHKDFFVQCDGWYQNRYCLFIAMEYIPYGDLGTYIRAGKAKANARAITQQVLEGLNVLHEREICHRDIKPQNILIAEIDPIRIKICDFGVSKVTKGTELRTMVGTTAYMAPELFAIVPSHKGTTYSNMIDMWGVGCILHEMLTSEIPFQQSNSTAWPVTSTPTVISPIPPTSDDVITPAAVDELQLKRFCENRTSFPLQALHASHASFNSIKLVQALLIAEPRGRLGAKLALQSAWIAGSSNILMQFIEAVLHLTRISRVARALRAKVAATQLKEETADEMSFMETVLRLMRINRVTRALRARVANLTAY